MQYLKTEPRESVSVIVLAIGKKAYLREALQSALAESRSNPPLDIVVACEAESDWPERRSFEQLGVRFCSVTDTRVGPVIKAALRVASSDIISFLDGDDLFLPGKIAFVQKMFSEHEDLVYVNNACEDIDSTGELVPFIRRPARSECEMFSGSNLTPARFRRIRGLEGDFNSSCISARRSILDGIGLPLDAVDGNIDSFLLYLGLLSNGKVMISGQRLTRYRQHPGGSTAAGSRVSAFVERRTRLLHRRISTAAVLVRFCRQLPTVSSVIAQAADADFASLTLTGRLLGGAVRISEIAENLGPILRGGSPGRLSTRAGLFVLCGLSILSSGAALRILHRWESRFTVRG